MGAWNSHLEATCALVGFTRQSQTQVHEIIKLVTAGSAAGALHSAQILALEQVMNDTVASALAVVPSFVSLCRERALASQLPVRGPTLHPFFSTCTSAQKHVGSCRGSSSCQLQQFIEQEATEFTLLPHRNTITTVQVTLAFLSGMSLLQG